MGEVDRLTAEVAGIARQSLREAAAVRRAAHRAAAHRPGDGWLARLAGQLDQTVTLTGGCCGRPASGLPATAASRIEWFAG